MFNSNNLMIIVLILNILILGVLMYQAFTSQKREKYVGDFDAICEKIFSKEENRPKCTDFIQTVIDEVSERFPAKATGFQEKMKKYLGQETVDKVTKNCGDGLDWKCVGAVSSILR